MSGWKKNSFCRFVAKVLVFFMMIQGMPLWELSNAYKWEFQPRKLQGILDFLSLIGPKSVEAATPEADAGSDQSAIKDLPVAGTVLLTGSGSSDSDGDPLNYQWYGPFFTTSGATPSVEIPEGTYSISLAVDDGSSLSNVDTATITVNACFNISARAKSGKVQLTWTHLDGTEGYDIYRSDESDPYNLVKIGETTSTYSTYLDEPVANEITYLYVVGALSQDTWCYSNVTSSHPTALRTRTPVNYAPVIYSSPIEHGTAGIVYNYDTNATDPNGNTLSYSLLTSPSGMSIDTTTGLITWTPEAAGTYNVTVEVSDGSGGADAQTYAIDVEEIIIPNRTPVATDQQVNVHENFPETITLTGSDPDGDPLIFLVLTNPSHGSLSGTPPDLTYTPVQDYRGDDSFDFQVDDNNGGTATATVSISVFSNQLPRITSMPLTVAALEYEYVYPVIAVDPDEDPLAYSLVAAPDGMVLEDAGVLRWTPTEDQISDFGVSIQVADGYGGIDTQTYWIRVSTGSSETANHAPIAHAGDDYTMDEGAQDILDGSHSFDADDDHFSYWWVQTAGPEVELDKWYAQQPRFTAPEVDENTLLTFELIVNDGTVDSEIDEVNVMILNMDLPPEGNGMVTNSNLEGHGSLKAAATYANANPGTRITFNIPDTDPKYDSVRGVWQLPNPTMGSTYGGGTGLHLHGDGWTLDGYSQTENQGDRNPFGPEIEIDDSHQRGTVGVSGDNNVIRGIAFAQWSNTKGVLMICPGKNMVVEGNYIGADATGTTLRGYTGLVMSTHACAEWGWGGGYYQNQFDPQPDWTVRVGGSRPGQGNIIAAEAYASIAIGRYVGPESVTIQGNLIGLDRTGTIPLATMNGGDIEMDDYNITTSLTIGGVTPGSRNVILAGIYFYAGDNAVVIQGNYIGTDITGSVAVTPEPGTAGNGIQVADVDDDGSELPGRVLIGGGIPGAGNVIGGFLRGIRLVTNRAINNLSLRIQGNLIGTDATGTQALGNSSGIVSAADPEGLIGGTGPNEGNIISGNRNDGIIVSNRDRLIVQGNKIGVGSDGVTPLPNGRGIKAAGYGYSIIGGTEEGAGNIIAFNNGPGIEKMVWATCNTCPNRASTVRILGNQIHDNGGMGIDGLYVKKLFSVPEAYIEGLQNYPVINATEADNGITRVMGNLSTSNPQNCLVEIFANRGCDASGYGEGERWLAALTPEVDGSFETTIPENLSGLYLTATATRMTRVAPDPRINSSGFSRCRLVGDSAITNEPPVITSDPVTTATAETPYSYQVTASDPEGGPLDYALALAPEGMSIDADGLVSWTPTIDQEGRQTITVVVRDAEGLYASQNFRVQVLPLVDTEPPVVSVVIPADLTVDEPYGLTGTITDPYLAWYGIEIAPAGSGNYRQIAEGTTSIQGDILGTIDPTLLANGLYDVRVIAYDEDGHLTVFNASTPIEINSKLKIGQFSLAFQDTSIPVSGVPITVTRTYNSFDKEKGDFGIGWDMALISGIKIQVTRTLGTGWQAVQSGSWLGSPTYVLETDNVPKVLVTYADGRQDRFEFTPSFIVQPPISPDWVRPSFTALEGTTATLDAVDTPDLLLDNGQLLDLGSIEVGPFDPDRFRLTTAEGMELVISMTSGLESITDRNGNRLSFGPSGISHSSGLAIVMDRDGSGRITRITDPIGYEVAYAYNAVGDLVGFTDQEGNLTEYGYDFDHNLISIIDPRGIEVLQTQYDELGRMIGTVDGLGNTISITHDTENTIEYVTDRNGHTTAYEYDSEGNIISETDPLGNITYYTYDADGNKLSETDSLGNTTTWTYDVRGNQLTETDALGNIPSWTYNSRNQLLTTTDSLGNATTYTYDSNGNMLTKTDALGNTSTYAYDVSGNMLSKTDCQGNVTVYTYDAHGNKLTATDPLGNVTAYTYDSNGNVLTETDPLGNTTTKEYDNLGNIINITDSLGNIFTTEYNAIGKKVAEVDKLGYRTEYEYDENGNIVQTTYPDGTVENSSYDGNGNRIRSTDRAGRVTQFEYDAGNHGSGEQATRNRLVRITHPDGNSISFEYDAVGRITATVDENGNRTEDEYDAVGRKIRTIDALGNITTFTYDVNGNQLSMTDANGNTTSYIYDALNRRITTIFTDGTSTTAEYGAGCCSSCRDKKISETDQAGITTFYEYDALGRLIRVIDALGNETIYSYNSMGNKLTQTDANGNTTSFTYDSLGRLLIRTLPMGQGESYTYDANGNVLMKTDFNGDIIAYTYDAMKRIVRKQYTDSSEVSFTYTATGKRETVTDGRGVTSYTYNLRDRLLTVTHPDGSSIGYTYDAKGNRTSVTVPSGTTTYTYDALNRPATVTDSYGGVTTYTYDSVGNRANVTYPNGTVAEYTYDSLNRLTYLENRDSSSVIISSFAYTLGAAGNRLRVTEDSGRVVDYSYDSLYRLTQEDITDPALGNETIDYTYDPVGNRLTNTDSSGTTTYIYNANDQLITEAGPGYTNTYAYDNNGNTVSKSDGITTTTYDYDYENRLVQTHDGISTTAYGYDVDGIRTASNTDGIATYYLVDKNRPYSQVLEERDGSDSLIVSYMYGDDLISQNRGGILSYYHYDGQMSTRNLTDGSAGITDSFVYDAFGILLGHGGTTENHYLYTGEQYDPNVGFYYLRARYYDENTGRFVTHDPVLGNQFEPVSLHRYLYANVNPVMYFDPSGETNLLLLTGTMVIVGILAALTIVATGEDYIGRREKAAVFNGRTKKFLIRFEIGAHGGAMQYYGASLVTICEDPDSLIPLRTYCARYIVFDIGVGVGAGFDFGLFTEMNHFQAPGKRSLIDFRGLGVGVSFSAGGQLGCGYSYLRLPEGSIVEESFSCGGSLSSEPYEGRNIGVSGNSVYMIWRLVASPKEPVSGSII
ncbi:MAG: cadherin-like domain-containing protein [Desulfosarcina sp.]|nr:cadherin-like domain-containing protein [Desulfosarcina sp.]MBC2741623.1 cadherin-like domain-containing protein [Desulfosarcina sp.]MBC2764537.1 cadherin-like domain-containing protein [Desulfosarcina sp.]